MVDLRDTDKSKKRDVTDVLDSDTHKLIKYMTRVQEILENKNSKTTLTEQLV